MSGLFSFVPTGYHSELGALFTVCAAAVSLVLTSRRFFAVTVPLWLVVQRFVAGGVRNRARPSHKGEPGVDRGDCKASFVLSRDMKDEDRPVAIVTGTNCGIGYWTAVGLAVEGYRVVCTCRSVSLSEVTAERIRKEAEGRRRRLSGNLRYRETPPEIRVDGRFCIEFDDFESVRFFARKFQETYVRLDVLVNNAGMMRRELEFSVREPMLELHTAVNFLSPLLLTELLIPLLKKSSGRVVYVSSAAHRYPRLLLREGSLLKAMLTSSPSDACLNGRLLESLKELNRGKTGASGLLTTTSLLYAFVRYGTSKLLNIYHAHYIARHHNVRACSLHPGCVASNFSRDLVPQGLISRIYQHVCLLFLKTSEEGAQTTLHCAMCDAHELRLVEPHGGGADLAVSPYFAECMNQTHPWLLRYAWDLEEGDRIVEWGKAVVRLVGEGE
ncbi:putative short-chain dehydrogenase [Trypanosoma vivax]|nr:putative short-chain dehydrogenase [Trypanosoma vivax]